MLAIQALFSRVGTRSVGYPLGGGGQGITRVLGTMTMASSHQFANLVAVGIDSYFALIVAKYHLTNQKTQIAYLILAEGNSAQRSVGVQSDKLVFHTNIAYFDRFCVGVLFYKCCQSVG